MYNKNQTNIYYFCSDYNNAAGGVKVIYRHVEILQQLGYSVSVLHGKRGFRCTWFANSCPVTSISEVQLTEDTIVVIPEIFFHLSSNPKISYKERLKYLLGRKTDYYAAKVIWQSPCRKIIFNQNAYYTLLDFCDKYPLSSSLFSVPIAYFSISEQNKKYLEYFIPAEKIHKVQWSLNTKYFYYSESKKNTICYMPRKNALHATQVVRLLKVRNKLHDFDFVAIENKNEQEVASLLRESMIFLSFGYPEGLPLPPAEAMACGCIVIGYHGGGGSEYFDEKYCYPIAYGDILGFVDTVERVCIGVKENPTYYKEISLAASEAISNGYSAQKEEKILAHTWAKLLK